MRTTRSLLFTVALVLLLGATVEQVCAQNLNPLERRGQALLTELCARCHAVGRTGASPQPNAPPFRTIASRYEIDDLVERLRNGFTAPHPEMPTFTFSRDAARTVRAYLYAIQK